MLDGGATYIRTTLSLRHPRAAAPTHDAASGKAFLYKQGEGGRVPSDLSVVFLQPRISHPVTPTHLYKVYVASIFVGPLISVEIRTSRYYYCCTWYIP